MCKSIPLLEAQFRKYKEYSDAAHDKGRTEEAHEYYLRAISFVNAMNIVQGACDDPK